MRKRIWMSLAGVCCLAAAANAADLTFDWENGNTDGWVAVDEKDLGDPAPSTWKVGAGGINGKTLTQSSNTWGDKTDTVPIGTFFIYDKQEFGNFILDVDVLPNDNDGMGVVWAYSNPETHYRVFMMQDGGNPPNGELGPWRRMEKRLGKDGGDKLPFYDKPIDIVKGDAYAQGAKTHWTLEVKSGEFKFSMDGKQVLKGADKTYKSGKIGFQLYAQNNVAFDNLVIKDLGLTVTPQGRLAVRWAGLKSER